MSPKRYPVKKPKSATAAVSTPIVDLPSTLPNAYLGQKGYTILKRDLTEPQQEQLRSLLVAKPLVNGMPTAAEDCFPIYRESPQKIYVPRYFGETTFGVANGYKVSEGLDIDLRFDGKMRDIQEMVIAKYMDHVGCGAGCGAGGRGGGGLLELYCGFGKTICALNIVSRLQKKTLIIVHKEFLMNQWIERIQQFLPTARIGKIQAQVMDIDDKDIVIGMLQSLSMKDYDPAVFDTFGFTIIDEVHHISSQVFSNVLFKLVTKYMLGLSATMNRKDGTTKVFKMFLGEVVYKCVRDNEDNVEVRAYQYRSDNEEFNTVSYDFRGNVLYSTMISKLCSYNSRSEYILNILVDLLAEDAADGSDIEGERAVGSAGSQQIMILAHNKNVLKYMHDAIKHRKIASVGYYVGGMKEADLKVSETKKVIIATYSMAAEALDIKTLTTLIMATPKTDIEQAVGRILREKHGKPIVVDIVDQHQPFKNQWAKRRAFYRKQNYKIIMMNDERGGKTGHAALAPRVVNDHDDDVNQRKCLINIEDMA